jgi:hypothetical protein
LTRKSTSSTPANPNQTRALICSLLVEASEKGFSLDSIDTVIQSVASAQLRTGDKAAAEATQKRIKTHGKRALAGTKARK